MDGWMDGWIKVYISYIDTYLSCFGFVIRKKERVSAYDCASAIVAAYLVCVLCHFSTVKAVRSSLGLEWYTHADTQTHDTELFENCACGTRSSCEWQTRLSGHSFFNATAREVRIGCRKKAKNIENFGGTVEDVFGGFFLYVSCYSWHRGCCFTVAVVVVIAALSLLSSSFLRSLTLSRSLSSTHNMNLSGSDGGGCDGAFRLHRYLRRWSECVSLKKFELEWLDDWLYMQCVCNTRKSHHQPPSLRHLFSLSLFPSPSLSGSFICNPLRLPFSRSFFNARIRYFMYTLQTLFCVVCVCFFYVSHLSKFTKF